MTTACPAWDRWGWWRVVDRSAESDVKCLGPNIINTFYLNQENLFFFFFREEIQVRDVIPFG